RPEHPRPDFRRDTYLNLNGQWQFAFDDGNVGLRERWQESARALDGQITVPFCYQCKASGIGSEDVHAILWYRRAFTVPQEMLGGRVLLRFGAVDYQCMVFVNGMQVGQHTGGYTPFAIDVTDALRDGDNDLCLRVLDTQDCAQPRGKQYWDRGLMGCWYTPVSGIWQTVYLEAVGEYALKQIHITPDVNAGVATFALALDSVPAEPLTLELTISFEGERKQCVTAVMQERKLSVPVSMIVKGGLDPVRLWSPDHPWLYDVQLRILKGASVCDTVHTYFGMRTIERKNGMVLLNNCPIYQRLVLDQGYWPDTLLTPPSDEALREDVELTLALGYNGARKHQKLEDPRYYYWADKLGMLVWGEVPSAYDFCDEMVANLSDTLLSFIDRDFNHPSLICWVPINESWGVSQIYKHKRQQETASMLYHLAKAADGTRLVSGNDGWEQVETDICALHDYAAEKEVMEKHFADREHVEQTACDWRMAWADGHTPKGDEAFMITEYGGIAFATQGIQGAMGGMETWGYHDKVTDEETFFQRFQAVTDAIRDIPYCQGYCYTQLTDVMQEINGVLSPDRQPKVDIKRFAALNHPPKGRA
ncbi:MAG: glycoside hydrolase family 2 TIM barrel-domain containing protein, partial [Clostridia bacterium]